MMLTDDDGAKVIRARSSWNDAGLDQLVEWELDNIGRFEIQLLRLVEVREAVHGRQRETSSPVAWNAEDEDTPARVRSKTDDYSGSSRRTRLQEGRAWSLSI
jgi:hypothetical protein